MNKEENINFIITIGVILGWTWGLIWGILIGSIY